MIFAIDFDGTVLKQDRPYDDTTSPLEFMPGAQEALAALKRADHTLLLWSARGSRWLLQDPNLCPLVRAGARRVNFAEWLKMLPIHRARYDQMLKFVADELPGIFDAIDDGLGGKPAVDKFIDDKAFQLSGMAWYEIAAQYGLPPAVPIG